MKNIHWSILHRLHQWRAAWYQRLDDRGDEPIPMKWVVRGCVLSLVALVLGVAFPNMNGYWQNMDADLTLLGPALVATHVFGRNYRRDREWRRVIAGIKSPVWEICVEIGWRTEHALSELEPYVSPKRIKRPSESTGTVESDLDEAASKLSVLYNALGEAVQRPGVCETLLDEEWVPFGKDLILYLEAPLAFIRPYIQTGLAELKLRQVTGMIQGGVRSMSDVPLDLRGDESYVRDQQNLIIEVMNFVLEIRNALPVKAKPGR